MKVAGQRIHQNAVRAEQTEAGELLAQPGNPHNWDVAAAACKIGTRQCRPTGLFRAKRVDRVKLLVCDGSGLTLIYKRLDQARFVWPRIEDGVMRLSPGQLGASRGLDWRRAPMWGCGGATPRRGRRVSRPQLAQ